MSKDMTLSRERQDQAMLWEVISASIGLLMVGLMALGVFGV